MSTVNGPSETCQQSCLCVRPWPWEYRRAQIISNITISLQPCYFLFFRFPGSQKRRMYCVNIQRSCIENLSYLKFKKGEYLKCFIFTHCDNILNLLSFPLCRLTANWNDWIEASELHQESKSTNKEASWPKFALKQQTLKLINRISNSTPTCDCGWRNDHPLK